MRIRPQIARGSAALLLSVSAGVLVSCAHGPRATTPQLAEDSPRAAVAAAHPVATQAGIEILAAGGNAIDAAIATAFALNVVEPHAGGMGGGGFIVYYDAQTGREYFLDYRETAPSALQEEHFSIDGSPSSATMRSGGMAVGAPGMARGLLEVHERHGLMPRELLLAPAIRAAEEGTEVSPQLALMSANRSDDLMEDEHAAEIFLSGGLFPLDEGDVIYQPALAETLRRVAAEGAAAINEGEGAEAIAARVQEAGGVLTAEDIAAFEPRWRDPLRVRYRDYDIVTVGPPSAGGMQLAYALLVLEEFDFTGMDPDDPFVLAALAAAGETASALAREHIADPDYMHLSVEDLLSGDRIAETRARIAVPAVGEPVVAELVAEEPVVEEEIAEEEVAEEQEPERRFVPRPWRPEDATEPVSLIYDGNTTHLSVIDAHGNAVALTQTINSFFGAGIMAGELGLMLNNEMFDFDFTEGSVNFPAPGKIPRSSMTPVLVFRDGQLVGTLGSPGGTRIPQSMARILTGKIDFELSLQEAVDLPRIFVDPRLRRISYESRLDAETVTTALGLVDFAEGEYSTRSMGDFDHYFGGAHACWLDRTPAGTHYLTGAADPRRDGVALTLTPAGITQ